MKALLRFCFYMVAGYGLLTLAVFLIQRRMIYFPDRSAPPAAVLRGAGLTQWPGQGRERMGYTNAAAPEDARGTVIVFHGNAGAAWHREYFVHALAPHGFHVVLAEYPGYGGRPGRISESSLVEDARSVVRQAHALGAGPIYLLGESMGCGVVAAVAEDPPAPLAGLILITPWDSLADLAQTLYWYLPARWLLRDRFDSISHLGQYTGPLAMAIASRDRIVPNKHSLRLYETLKGPKRLWRFENADHNTWPTHPQAPWWREVMQFVSGEFAVQRRTRQ